MFAVELVNLSKLYRSPGQKEFLAIDCLNLQIKSGEFFALLGPSGCGKTTTLRSIAGFELPTAGEIFIHGKKMGDLPPFHRPVNTVFQNYALFPHLTVGENIAFGLEMENLPKSEINYRLHTILEQVKLTGMAQRYPRQLSGGQQQRVALARALVKQPAVLLFDEPLGALDLKLRKEMQLELKQMQRSLGMTFIYVTHDQEEALTMCDRIAVMHQGKVLQIGTPRDIYENPNSRFVADFIGESNFLTGRVVEIKSDLVKVLVDERLAIEVAGNYQIKTGEIVTLVIRPEKAEIVNEKGDDQNRLIGKISEVIYLGTDWCYVVDITEKSRIIIRQQNLHNSMVRLRSPTNEEQSPTNEEEYRIGEMIEVRILPHHVKLLV